MEPDARTKADALKALDAYLIVTTPTLLTKLSLCADEGGPIAGLVRDALAGLQSVLDAASIPFALTCSFVQDMRFQQILAAERIRTLKGTSGSAVVDELKASRSANAKMTEFMTSEEGSDWLRDRVASSLAHGLKSEDVSHAAAELLYQALVGTWSVFEVFSGALIVEVLNANPRAATALVAGDIGRRHFAKPVIGIEALEAHNFNATNSMGTILFENKRLDNLTIIKDMLTAIFDDSDVDSKLKCRELYLLNQRRHLIVHKRAVVDRDYLSRTSEALPIGAKLKLSSEDIERYVETVATIIDVVARSSGLQRVLAGN